MKSRKGTSKPQSNDSNDEDRMKIISRKGKLSINKVEKCYKNSKVKIEVKIQLNADEIQKSAIRNKSDRVLRKRDLCICLESKTRVDEFEIKSITSRNQNTAKDEKHQEDKITAEERPLRKSSRKRNRPQKFIEDFYSKEHKEMAGNASKRLKRDDKIKDNVEAKSVPKPRNYKNNKVQSKENKVSPKLSNRSKKNEVLKTIENETLLDMWLDKKLDEGKIFDNPPEKQQNSSNTSMDLKSGKYKHKRSSNKESKSSVKSTKAKPRLSPTKASSKSTKIKKSQNKPLSPVKQSNLDNFIQTRNTRNKTQFMTHDCSLDSFDLPSFSSKTTKRTGKKSNNTLPTVQEILNDQRELDEYKAVLATFKPLSDADLELPFSVKDLLKNVEHIENLDCKQVSMDDLKVLFKNHSKYLDGIIHGTVYNERHVKFFDLNRRQVTFTCEDLTYNTSMIVFSYTQKQYLLKLLTEAFDPDDTKMQYFFKVLLPELCLLIFMDVHQMSRVEALEYLDKRPILPDD